ncbi:hypothetical protein [Nocardiopsis sp. NPDC058789]|uniref:hypothetical protein n=1 Tax=Nocardiopsis sp. NPDC058789 TaxID=3346634 RepID=UPI00366B797F
MSSGLMAFSVDMDRISRPASETVRSQCEMYGRFLDNRCFYPVSTGGSRRWTRPSRPSA